MTQPIFIGVTDRFNGLEKLVNVNHIIHFGARPGDDGGTEIVTTSHVERIQAIESPDQVAGFIGKLMGTP